MTEVNGSGLEAGSLLCLQACLAKGHLQALHMPLAGCSGSAVTEDGFKGESTRGGFDYSRAVCLCLATAGCVPVLGHRGRASNKLTVSQRSCRTPMIFLRFRHLECRMWRLLNLRSD